MIEAGTISEGTLRSQDLIPKFLDVLDAEAPERASEFRAMWSATIESLDLEPADAVGAYERAGVRMDSDDPAGTVAFSRDQMVSELIDELNEIAPPDLYFGTHPGDGADYGFWPVEDD